MSDTVTIGGLPVAPSANLTGAAMIEVQDSTGTSGETTLATLRTKMFAGGTGYTAADPLTVGAVTATSVTSSGGFQVSANVGAPVAGLGRSASFGFIIAGVTGSSTDLSLLNGLGQTVLDIPTGTLNLHAYGSLTIASGLTVSAGGITVSAGTTAVQAMSIAGKQTFTTAFGPTTDTGAVSIALANNASTTLSFSYAAIEICETQNFGDTAYFVLSGGGVSSIVFQSGTRYSTVNGTAAKINISFSGSIATFENKTGSPITLQANIRKLG